MIQMKDMPKDILGIHASGTITQDDYKKVLIPATEQKFGNGQKIKILFYLENLQGAEPAAIWEDFVYGIKNWHNFSHIALVTNHQEIRMLTMNFGILLPAEIRTYDEVELDQALKWLERPNAIAA